LKNGKSKAGAERDLFKKHPLTQANPKVYWFLVGAYCQPTTLCGHQLQITDRLVPDDNRTFDFNLLASGSIYFPAQPCFGNFDYQARYRCGSQVSENQIAIT